MSDNTSDAPALTIVDLARIRIAVEDHAGTYYGGPVGFSKSDAVRYTTEGRDLRTLCGRKGFATVWRAVEAIIDAHPEVLQHRYSHAELDARKAARRAAAEEVDRKARVAYEAGQFGAALRLLDEVELTDPDYPYLDQARAKVRSKLAEAEAEAQG